MNVAAQKHFLPRQPGEYPAPWGGTLRARAQGLPWGMIPVIRGVKNACLQGIFL
jgi:hypothetical protein